MTNDQFEYDVALSFAGKDRAVAEELTSLLTEKGIHVFRDEYNAADAEAVSKDRTDHVVNLYARKARYCVLLISQHYPLKAWTEEDRTSAQERALRDAHEYILPIQLDGTDARGVAEAAGYKDLREHSMESICDLLEQKLAASKSRSGPPSQSHDLRSGNVPTQSGKSD